MTMTFEDILNELHIDIEKFKILDRKFKEIEDPNANEIHTDVIETKRKYYKIANEIGANYYEKIVNEGYFLSVEDIAKHLDVTVRFVMSSVVNELDRLEFPCGDYEVKKIMKSNYIIPKLGEEKKLALYYHKFRKKVLFSTQSYINFLKNHMELQEENKAIKINLDDSLVVELIRKSNKIMENEDCFINENVVENIVNKAFNMFLKARAKDIKACLLDSYDFEKMVLKKFNRNTFLDEAVEFKAMSSLRILFNKVYDIEVLRIVSKAKCDVAIFNLNLSNKPIRRYVMSKEFIKEKVNEQFQEVINTKEPKENIFNVIIPKSYFIKTYNQNIDLLTNDFIKYAKRIKEIR